MSSCRARMSSCRAKKNSINCKANSWLGAVDAAGICVNNDGQVKDTKLKNGHERKAGDTVLASDKLMPGTEIRVSAAITCPAASNYYVDGEKVIETTYRVIEAKQDISKCNVVILNSSKLSYSNGKQIYLIKGKDFKVTTKVNGKTTTLSTNDYEIESITNNKFLGTATVVLRGKGNYGGTKKFTFKIKAKSVS